MPRQCYEYHPVTALRFVPGVRARIPHEGGGYLMRVNGQGFRSDREFVPGREGSSRRILVFGDSFTAGDGVSNGKRYSDLIEAMVPGTETYNFGLPSSGTDQQFLAWREFAKGIEHDVLVVGVLVENVIRNTARFREFRDDSGRLVVLQKPYFTVDRSGALSLHHCPPDPQPMPSDGLPGEVRAGLVREGRFGVLRRMLRKLGLSKSLQGFARFQPFPEYNSRSSDGWRLLRAILLQWIREHGDASRFVIMPIPLYQYIEGLASARAYQARFAELCAEAGCVMHDPLPDLLGYSAAERRAFRFQNDAHFTPEGHAALAKSLAPAITAILARTRSAPTQPGMHSR
jgi:lysophospholipase L1-like esterase